MAFRTRRQNRYLQLRKIGALPFEARPWSKVPFGRVPYMKDLINDRIKLFQQAQREGLSIKRWEDRIKDLYNKNKWLKAGKRRIEADPWKMLRDYENKWRVKNPSYTSPWEARWKGWKDFLARAERTIQKQTRKGVVSTQ